MSLFATPSQRPPVEDLTPASKKRKFNSGTDTDSSETGSLESISSHESNTKEFAEDGDLILVVGKEKFRFRVHSIVLRNASRVFNAMLGPNFSEGRRLRESNGDVPIEIELPEDEPEYFSLICQVLHGNDSAVAGVKAQQVQGMAILIDKYDMGSRFHFAIIHWFDSLRQDALGHCREAWRLMTAAYWLRKKVPFYYFSKILVNDKRIISFLIWASTMEDQTLGLRLCLAIEELKNQALRHGLTSQRGLCLHCFQTTRRQFSHPEAQCADEQFHKRPDE